MVISGDNKSGVTCQDVDQRGNTNETLVLLHIKAILDFLYDKNENTALVVIKCVIRSGFFLNIFSSWRDFFLFSVKTVFSSKWCDKINYECNMAYPSLLRSLALTHPDTHCAHTRAHFQLHFHSISGKPSLVSPQQHPPPSHTNSPNSISGCPTPPASGSTSISPAL